MYAFPTGDSIYGQSQSNTSLALYVPMGGIQQFVTNVTTLTFTPGATTQNIAMMRGQSRTVTTAPVASAGTSIPVQAPILTADGATASSSGIVGIQQDDGSWLVTPLTAITATTLTLTTGPATPRTIVQGAKVVYFGLATDAYHTNYTFSNALQTANTAFNLPVNVSGGQNTAVICRASGVGEPVLFYANNSTNKSTLTVASWGYQLPPP